MPFFSTFAVEMRDSRRKIELLAPARDAEVAIEAILHGADAVYMGPDRFGARAMAGNSIEDIGRVCGFAHQYRARVYATVNTLVTDGELRQVERLITDLYHAGVDAIIVQDLSILRLDIPPIALHASTQCDLRTPEKARFLESLGFSQLVMARELSLQEIAEIRQTVKVPLEAFVHGALCVCYSGRCGLSQAVMGRSANRGQCAQMCRHSYDLVDTDGNTIVSQRHLLSLQDLNQHDRLEEMLEAGVSSFKIEGRLKDASYVKNVVASYRQELDRIIDRNADKYVRSSAGTSCITFTPDLQRSFNRSFTHYFLDGRDKAGTMASIVTPKSQGQPLGKVEQVHGNTLRIDTHEQLTNGDGLSFVNAAGQFDGARVNVVRGRDIVLRDSIAIKRGTMIYRTFDKAFEDTLSRQSATRTIGIDASLHVAGGALVLTIDDERGNHVVHSINAADLQRAQSPQDQRQKDVLSKLGNTIYRLNSCLTAGEWFIPASVLTQLRRETIDLLDRANQLTHPTDRRRPEDKTAPLPYTDIAPADNVANALSRQLYEDRGATTIEPAIEVNPGCADSVPLMQTRYCLRRELGACLKTRDAGKLPRQLFLRTGQTLLRVECDCRNCEMRLYMKSK